MKEGSGLALALEAAGELLQRGRRHGADRGHPPVAQPPAQRAFCPRANEIAQLVSSTPTAKVIADAPAYLAQLDQPFLDFYEAYAKYQSDAVAWDAKYAPPPPIMSAPAPMNPVGPTNLSGSLTTTNRN